VGVLQSGSVSGSVAVRECCSPGVLQSGSVTGCLQANRVGVLQSGSVTGCLQANRVGVLQSGSVTGCLQIQPNQIPGDIQDKFSSKIPEDFLCDKPYNPR